LHPTPARHMAQSSQHAAPHRITHACLDLDGTLAHSIPAMRAAYANFLKRFGIQDTDAEFQELNGPSLREIVDILKHRYNLSNDPHALLRGYTADIAAAYTDTVQPMPGAHAMLRELKAMGLTLILVTANVRAIASGFIAAQGWDALFDAAVFGDDVTHAKPAPHIYLAALERARAHAAHTAALEDSPNGVRSAAAAGLLPIGFAPDPAAAAALSAAGARRIISTLIELPSAINEFSEPAP